MNHLDELIGFLFENISDDRISLNKKMKYGHRHYYLCLDADLSEKDNHIHINHVTIVVDCRNNCIEIIDDAGNIVIEDNDAIKKWSGIFEEYLNKSAELKLSSYLKDILSNCKNPSLWREMQMKDLFTDDDITSE
jgi:hypothetical protein